MYILEDYDAALRKIMTQGVKRTSKRTGQETRSIFGMMCRYKLTDRFPLLTRRKIWPKAIFAELLWFLSGSTNNHDLQELGSNIWTPWVDPEFEKKHGYVSGSLGPVYGFQLRHFGGWYGEGRDVDYWKLAYTTDDGQPEYYWETRKYGEGGFDQLTYMIDRIKEDPSCRRILFDLWNPSELHKMKLPPCHYSYQILIDDDGLMTGILTQRSADFPVGVPANIQFYSALTMMIAQQTGYTPYEFVHNTIDSHIYADQFEAVEEYLGRDNAPDSPRLNIKKAEDITSYSMNDFEVIDYYPLDKIKIPVAV